MPAALSNRCPRNRSDGRGPASALLVQRATTAPSGKTQGPSASKARTPSVTHPPTGGVRLLGSNASPAVGVPSYVDGRVRSTLRSRDSPSTPRAGLPAKRGPGYDPGAKGDRPGVVAHSGVAGRSRGDVRSGGPGLLSADRRAAEGCAELPGVDLATIRRAAADVEPYVRVDVTQVWFVMRMERRLWPEAYGRGPAHRLRWAGAERLPRGRRLTRRPRALRRPRRGGG